MDPPPFKGVVGVEPDKGGDDNSSRGAGVGNNPGACRFGTSRNPDFCWFVPKVRIVAVRVSRRDSVDNSSVEAAKEFRMASQPLPPEEAPADAPIDIPVPAPTDPEPFVPTDPVMQALPG